jgi:hypothetical protein
LELSLRVLLPNLKKEGDFTTKRCATHVHIGAIKNIQFLKNMLKLGLWADDLLFVLAGMGDEFRGNQNNAQYSRPLIKGQCFYCRGSIYRSLNYKKALLAKDCVEFFSCFGIKDLQAFKYHPARYFALNLLSVLLYGTVEFRYLNESFDSDLVLANIKLYQLLVYIASKIDGNINLEVSNIFNKFPKKYYVDKLFWIANMGENTKYALNSREISLLVKSIEISKEFLVENEDVFTHLKEVEVNSEICMDYLEEIDTDVKSPNQIDIHNIKNWSIIENN